MSQIQDGMSDWIGTIWQERVGQVDGPYWVFVLILSALELLLSLFIFFQKDNSTSLLENKLEAD